MPDLPAWVIACIMGRGRSARTGRGYTRRNSRPRQPAGPLCHHRRGQECGAWPRPVARRLCQLVLVSPGRRVSREVASDKLFPALAPRAAAHAVSKALSMARIVLADLGGPATEMLVGDRTHTYISPNCPVDIDLERHQDALRFALRLQPGSDRDAALAEALSDEGVLLEDEAYSDWALRPRDSLELARHEARLALARDRARGTGRSSPEAVGQAWEACLGNDPTCEEAACALMRLYSDQGRRYAAEAAYHRCHAALEELGLPGSPALEAAHALALPRASAGPVLVPVRRRTCTRRAPASQRPLRRTFRPLWEPCRPRRAPGDPVRRSGRPDQPRRSLRGHPHFGVGRRHGGGLRRTRLSRGRPREGSAGGLSCSPTPALRMEGRVFASGSRVALPWWVSPPSATPGR